ncbi:phospholipase D-like domain-containing protein DpdK [Gordonia bronchialis]|uniref:phospholipase D-like domain-containing protein DpdK n=1 Tax=Gordonia bronchialis TaxID=2054 RepID=UPI00226FAA7B|nr:phospholipase D-like domain-containing protein DpdK [Gordonia bronchialis]
MNRVIRKSQNASASEAADLLAGLFSAELCLPSRSLWLVSPWVSNVELLDNSAGTFGPLTRFGKRRVRLAEILVALASSGTHVVVGTTADEHNKQFLERLGLLAEDMRVGRLITTSIDASNNLHTKALTGDDFALTGSMNITFNGIQIREELVDLRTDEAYVAQARMDAFDRFGGAL